MNDASRADAVVWYSSIVVVLALTVLYPWYYGMSTGYGWTENRPIAGRGGYCQAA